MNKAITCKKLVTPLLAVAVMGGAEPARAQAQQPGSDETAVADSLPFKYTGNLYSLKFHRPRCPFCRVMSESKKIRFHFRYQAIAQGYVPCRYCLPPTWTSVRAVIKAKDLNTEPLGTAAKGPQICSP